jgi:FKBP-type peptidyl-prolyl cis-trans isomerase
MENKKDMNIVLAVVICLIVAAVIVFISIRNKVNNTNMPSNNNIGTTTNDIGSPDTTPTSTSPTPTTTDNQSAPAGTVAKTGDTVAMNYTGRLADGTVFDSNVDPKFNHVTPFIFTLGAGQVITGWDKGIVGMKVGEEKTLVIPPADAYGANGVPPTIPPNATLTFDVTLLAIKK